MNVSWKFTWFLKPFFHKNSSWIAQKKCFILHKLEHAFIHLLSHFQTMACVIIFFLKKSLMIYAGNITYLQAVANFKNKNRLLFSSNGGNMKSIALLPLFILHSHNYFRSKNNKTQIEIKTIEKMCFCSLNLSNNKKKVFNERLISSYKTIVKFLINLKIFSLSSTVFLKILSFLIYDTF